MGISLDKILTVSPTEWALSEGTDLSKYRMVGVHYETEIRHGFTQSFADKVPRNAVVVTRFQTDTSSSETWISTNLSYMGHGTALIPKDEGEDQ